MANEENMSVDELATEALKLSAEDRERLAFAILSSIQGELEYESEWAKEAQRRLEQLENGSVDAIPAEDVFREARERLK